MAVSFLCLQTEQALSFLIEMLKLCISLMICNQKKYPTLFHGLTIKNLNLFKHFKVFFELTVLPIH